MNCSGKYSLGDLRLLYLARRCCPERRRSVDVSDDWLALCGRHRQQIEEVARLAPSLLRLLGLLMLLGHIEPDVPALLRLKGSLRSRGLRNAGWRRLLVDPARPVWRLVDRGLLFDRSVQAALVDWTRVHHGLGHDQRLPSAMWQVIAHILSLPFSGNVVPGLHWTCHPGVLAGALEAGAQARRGGRWREFIDGDWSRFVRWNADYEKRGRVVLPRTWAGALRAVAADERRARAFAAATPGVDWSFEITDFTHGGLRAIPLDTPSAVVEEALAMCHCVDRYIAACEYFGDRVYSLRDEATGKRVATVHLEAVTGGLRLADVRGCANAKPSRTTFLAAVALYETYAGLPLSA